MTVIDLFKSLKILIDHHPEAKDLRIIISEYTDPNICTCCNEAEYFMSWGKVVGSSFESEYDGEELVGVLFPAFSERIKYKYRIG